MKKLLFILSILFGLNTSAQVGYQANQYMFNHQLINPAYAGKDFKVKTSLLGSSHLTGISSAPTLLGLSISSPIGLSNSNVGLNVISFNYGVESNAKVSGIYTYRLSFDKAALVLGMQGDFVSMASNNSALHTSAVEDPKYLANNSGTGFNAGAGIFFSTAKSYISVSAPSWFQNRFKTNGDLSTDVALDDMPLFFSVGHEKEISKDWGFNPYMLYRMQTSGYSQLDITPMFSYKNKFWFGPYYKTGSQYGFVLGGRLNQFLQFSYAGGISQQARSGFAGSGHELSIGMNVKDKKVSTVNSLRFF